MNTLEAWKPTAPPAVCDKDHIYTVEAQVKPGFSEILEKSGFPKNKFWTEEGRAEGAALHKWLLFLAQGNVPNAEPDPRIAGRVRGIQKFFAENEFLFVGGEVPLYCPSLGYCVTPDLFGYLNGTPTVIEAKRGAAMARHKLQTAAQFIALTENGFPVENRLGLNLKNEGYTPDPHDDDEDFEAWRGIVAGHFAKERYSK